MLSGTMGRSCAKTIRKWLIVDFKNELSSDTSDARFTGVFEMTSLIEAQINKI